MASLFNTRPVGSPVGATSSGDAMRRVRLATALAFLLVPSAAAAGTAEEAIAYVFMGRADGARIERGKSQMTWTETSKSPATYDGVWTRNGNVNKIGFAVTATNNCDFVIQLAGPPAIVPQGNSLFARIEWRKVTGISPGR